MDDVYMIYARRWVSEPVYIKSYFNDFKDRVEAIGYQYISPKVKKKDDMQSLISIMHQSFNEKDFASLENYCSLEKLTIANEPSPVILDAGNISRGTYQISKIPQGEECNLETIRALKQPNEIEPARNYSKYTSTVFLNAPVDNSPDMTPATEPILIIRVYEPFKYTTGVKPTVHCLYEVSVRGKQTLAEFRDKILCSTDLGVAGDLSENPDQPVTETAKDRFKSGFIFIEDVFYNDFRDPSNKDYSAVIREWAERKDLGPFKTADMASTKFEDLTIRFGFPYVYQHQGKCEHLLIFSDARLLHELDPLSSICYPRYHTLGLRKARYCFVCNLFIARWITLGNAKVSIDPCYFCNRCFKSCNYKDGKKIGDFTAYRYLDITCLF